MVPRYRNTLTIELIQNGLLVEYEVTIGFERGKIVKKALLNKKELLEYLDKVVVEDKSYYAEAPIGFKEPDE